MTIRTRKTILALAIVLGACSRGDDPKPTPDAPAPAVVRAAEPIPNQWLVVLKPGTEDVASVARALVGDAAGAWTLRHYERALRGFALHADEATALAIASDPRVAWVAEDGRARTQSLVTQLFAPAGLDRVDQRSGTNGTYQFDDLAGVGVHAYVLDTGVLSEHVEFRDREPDQQDFVGDGDVGDCNGHGTHVAGIVGGGRYGVAKRVTLHALRVLGCDGTGATSDVVAALDWLVANAQRPAVANLSLGRDPDAALDAAVQAVVAAGIPVVVAAGDGGRDACTRSPARVPSALTVASTVARVATDESPWDLAAAAFTNQGPCVDLFAPGEDVRSASIAPSDDEPPVYVLSVPQSGTSASAPFVTGAAALWLARHPDATPDAVARALFANSTRAPAVGIDAATPDRFLFTPFVADDHSGDAAAPAAAIGAPLAGAVASGADVSVTATASDDVGVTRVELFANGFFVASSDAAPYAFVWNTLREPNGAATLVVRAYDAAGNATDSAPVAVTVQNDGVAHFDASLGVPRCETPAPACDSVDLLSGRADLGPEANAPNVLEAPCPTASRPDAVCRCADGPFGRHGLDESIERVTVWTLNGGALAAGADVQVDVQVYVGSVSYDALDLFSSPSVVGPAWRHLGTLEPTASGLQTLSARFTLPEGGVQAVRAALRYGGTVAACTEGGFDERDDLAFVAGSGAADVTPPAEVAITAPAAGAKVSGTITVAASATDDHLVSRVDFLVGATQIGSAFAPPYEVEWNSGLVPNGAYSFRAIATDGAGNATESAAVQVEVKDETPPAVAILSPADGTQLAQTPITVEVSAADAGVVKRVELWVNDALYDTDVTAPYQLTWGAGTGTWRLVARAWDGAGNFADSAPVNVSVGDTVPPSCTVLNPPDLATVVGTVMLEAAATDDKGVASVQFFLEAAGDPLEPTVTTAPWSIPWETGRLENGTYTLWCVARDASGNENAPASPAITVTVEDVADPVVTVVSPPVTHADGSVVPTPVSGTIVLEASAGDDGAVERVEFFLDDATTPIATATQEPFAASWNSGSVKNGEHAITAKAFDYNGHSGVSAPVAITTADDAAPVVAMVFPLAGATLGGTVPVRAQVTDVGGQLAKVELLDGDVLVTEMAPAEDGVGYGAFWSSETALPGTHLLTVRATDLNGHVGTAAVEVTVDPNAAEFDATAGAPACAAEATSCHSSWLLDGRGALGPEANAPNTLRAAAACADGAAGTYHADESIDFIAIRSVSGGALTSGVLAEIEVRAWVFDPAQDRVELFYATDAAAPDWVRLPRPTLGGDGARVVKAQVVLGNGASQAVRASIRYGATDADAGACIAGDYNDHDDLVFAVAAATDVEPPSVTIVEPADGATVTGTVRVVADATDDVGVARVQLVVDGNVAKALDAAPWEWTWDTAALAPGSHAIVARATDWAGNVAESDPVTVVVKDQRAPTVSLTAPLGNEAVMGTVPLAATAADEVGVAKVEFYVGGQLVATDLASPWSVSWNSASKADGVVTVVAKAVDAAGNAAQSEPISILVSNSGNARWDNARKAPACASPATKCFTGTLVDGRGPLGPEPNAPNTLGATCADGEQGTYHVDESVDAIVVRSPTGTLTIGQTAIVEVEVWAGRAPTMDALDVYVTADAAAASPQWVKIATLQPTTPGPQVLSTTTTLPSGTLQAVRAQLRYAGDAAIVCGAGTFDDRDDLVFAVSP